MFIVILKGFKSALFDKNLTLFFCPNPYNHMAITHLLIENEGFKMCLAWYPNFVCALSCKQSLFGWAVQRFAFSEQMTCPEQTR